ncbi:MAG: hypothetical protein Q7S59_08890 [Sulfurimonas sp.]|nr:hypothetical protein [Sulfurimonas sp.]
MKYVITEIVTIKELILNTLESTCLKLRGQAYAIVINLFEIYVKV